MPELYITSDQHIGDPIMLKYRSRFRNIAEHDFATWGLLDQVAADDIVIFLGDSFLIPESLEKLAMYPFQKMLIPGNHEFEKGVTIEMLNKTFNEIQGSYRFGNYWLTHIPMHPDTLGGRFNIHGHIHSKTKLSRDERYINVTPEATGYRLISFTEILNNTYHPWTY